MVDASMVLSSYYFATFYLAKSIKVDVQMAKADYLKKFDAQSISSIP